MCQEENPNFLHVQPPPKNKTDRTYPLYLLHQPARGEKKLVKCGTSQEEIITFRDVLQQRRCSLMPPEPPVKRNKNASILHSLCNRVKACVRGVNADSTEAAVCAFRGVKVWSLSETCGSGGQLSTVQARTNEGKSERMWSPTGTYLIS